MTQIEQSTTLHSDQQVDAVVQQKVNADETDLQSAEDQLKRDQGGAGS